MTAAVRGDAPRKLRSFGTPEASEILIPLVGAIVLTALLFAATPLSGALGFVFVAYMLFVCGYAGMVRRTHGSKAGADKIATVTITSAALLTVGALVAILVFVFLKGFAYLSWTFLTDTLEGVDPSAPSSHGGAYNAIVGTLIQVGLATLVAVPFGICTAVYLHEIGGRMEGLLRVIVDAMSGIPSIVAGLFIYAIWVVGAGQGFSGFAAALALGILMLPTVARTTEEMLKLVDPSLRECSLALGAPQWRTVTQVLLPTARAGIVTAVILGIARVAGETAPLLMTAFGNDRTVTGKTFTEPQSSLPLWVYQRFAQDDRGRAWAGALVLILLVLVLFIIARVVSRPRRAVPARKRA